MPPRDALLDDLPGESTGVMAEPRTDISLAISLTGGRHRRGAGRLEALARGGALNLFGLIVSGPMQIALTAVVGRGVGTTGTGAFFEAVALFTILSNVGELGADTALVKLLPQYRALRRNHDLGKLVRVALWPVVLFGLVFSTATWVLTPQITALLSHAQHGTQVQAYLRTFAPFITLGTITTVALAGTRGMGTMAPYVWIQNIFLPIMRPVLIGGAIYLGLGTLAVAIGWASPLGAAFLLGLFFLLRLIRQARSRGSGRPRYGRPATMGEVATEFWRFAGPRALAAVFGITITWLDILLVGAILHSAKEAGIYSAASRLSVLGASALSAVGMVVGPQVSELVTLGRIRDAEKVFQVGTWWLMALTWPGYIALAAFGPFLLRVFGHGFAAGYVALAILCFAQLFNLGTGNVTIVLLMAGKSSWNMINAATALAANITLNLLLIPRMGITGAAIAWAASIFANNLLALLEVNYLLKIRPFGGGYWVVAISSVVCFGVTGVIIRHFAGATAIGFALFLLVSLPPHAAVLWKLRGRLGLNEFRKSAMSRRKSAV